MPDQPTGPGSANDSVARTAQTTTTGQAATTVAADPYAERFTTLETLIKGQNEANKRAWDAIRSTTDKRLSDYERRMVRQAQPPPEDDFSFTDTSTRDNGSSRRAAEPQRPARNEDREQRRALLDYRTMYSGTSEYHDEVLAIAADPSRGGRYRVTDTDGEVDYFASLEAIHQSVELEALRKQKIEWDKSAQERQRDKSNQRRDATISGGGSSGGESPDVAQMTDEELYAQMQKEGLISETDRPRK